MKYSIQWGNDYSNFKYNESIDNLTAKMGAQLGAIEDVVSISEHYAGIYVSKIISCVKHPDADRLNICLIDDGGVTDQYERNEDGLIQVVCGAPNARVGIFVAWITPGSTVPSSYDEKEPFVLSIRDIRGQRSNGMLASPKELAISDIHDGILEIQEEDLVNGLGVGSEFVELFGLKDTIIDCENKMFTHRPDCFGVLGIAREIAGIFHQKFISPDWYLKPVQPTTTNIKQFKTNIKSTDMVSRLIVADIDNIKVAPSPIWLQSYLTRVGIRPINNIVDLTNYYMHLTGQPMHAYDYEKVKQASSDQPVIEARLATKGEKIKLINGKNIDLTDSDIVIATDKQVIGLAGIMGGLETEVDANTSRILLECATFNMYAIRRTTMRYGVHSDASTRYTKNQSPNQNLVVIFKLIDDIKNLYNTNCKINDIQDNYPQNTANLDIEVNYKLINKVLGMDIKPEMIAQLLTNVEFQVTLKQDCMIVQAPFWRMDIEIPEDVIEEIGRLYGYQQIPSELPHRDSTPAPRIDILKLKSSIRNLLSSYGSNELLTYNFVHQRQIINSNQDAKQAIALRNAISPELHYYRMAIAPNLLEKAYNNIKSNEHNINIFEIGKVHNNIQKDPAENSLPKESNRLAYVYSNVAKDDSYSYYQVKYILDQLLADLGYSPKYITQKSIDNFNLDIFDNNRSATILVNDTIIGQIGELHSKQQKLYKLPLNTALFELDLDSLLTIETNGINYQEPINLPTTSQDITIESNYNIAYSQLKSELDRLLEQIPTCLITSKLIDIYTNQQLVNKKRLTFNLRIQPTSSTLTSSQISSIIDEIADKLQQLGYKRI